MARCGVEELDGLPSMTALRELYLAYNEVCDISAVAACLSTYKYPPHFYAHQTNQYAPRFRARCSRDGKMDMPTLMQQLSGVVVSIFTQRTR